MAKAVGTDLHRSSVVSRVSVLLLSLLIAIPLAVVGAPPVVAAEPTPSLSAKINFQPNASAVPSGYTKDTGAAYDETAGFGWVREDSLAGTHVPYGLPINTRDRNACTNLPAPQRTFIHMQAPPTSTTNDATKGAWEYRLANGRYQVTVGVGDPAKGNDPETHVINVEGVRAIDEYPAATTASCVAATTTTNRLKVSTAWATVTDGKLTIDAIGGSNTKLAFVTIDSASVADLAAVPGTSAIDLDWSDTAGATGYRVWRSTNLPVSTAGAPLATTTDSAYSDGTAEKGTVYYYAVATAATGGADVVGAMIDDASPTQPALPAKFDFAETPGVTPTSVTPAGFTRDYGQNYANVRGYGWVKPGTATPVSLVGNGRSRVGGSSDPLNSPMHMQGNTVAGFANIPEAGAWQLAVPNGSYDVELAVGDATPGSDPTTHRINVEGVNAVDDFAITGTPTGAARFLVATKTVTVADGFLTVDAIGGINTKIDYVTVAASNPDQPPAKPTGLTATAGDGSVTLDWADNTDSDLKGYNVYRSTGATVDTAGTPLNSALIAKTDSTFTDATAANNTTYRYAVVAIDDADQKSEASDSVTATPDKASPTLATLPLQINFVDLPTAVSAPFTKDYGQAWTNTAGRGWVAQGTHTPLTLVGNGRLRAVRPGVNVDLRQRGLMHMQADDIPGAFTGIKASGSYEVAVPDGTYKVTVSAGDQPGATSYDSVHTLVVEGVTAIDAFQGTAATEFKTATVTVPVTDGRLTVDPTDGTNTKINYLDIDSVDVTAPAAPTGVTADAGDGKNTVTWTAATDSDVTGYNVYGAAGDTVTVSAATKLTATPQAETTYVHTGLTNGAKVSYVVTAVDAAGNESPASTVVDATPADSTAPAAPTNLLAVPGDATVSLRWTPPTDSDVTAYRIYRSESSPVALTNPIEAGDVLEYTDSPVLNDTDYFYVVTAVDGNGNESEPSEEKSATPTIAPDLTPPAAPAGLTAAAGDAKVTLSWTANADADLAGYRVYRSATAGELGTPVGTTVGVTTTFVDSTAVNGSKYFYVITALDVAGNESEISNEVNATPADTTPPAVPSGVTATAGVQSVTLRWNANTEPDLRGYQIFRSLSPTVDVTDDNNLIAAILQSAGRTFIDSDRDAGTTYYYAIVSYDQLLNKSAASATVSATPTPTPDTTAPAVVDGVTATVQDGVVALSWAASAATDLAGYTVYRSATPTGGRVKLTAGLLTDLTFTDTAPPAGTTSYYVVTASDTAANESVPSATVSADVPAAGVSVKFAFQPDTAPAITGYTKETGAAYSTTRGWGWVRQDSLGQNPATPLDLTLNTRLRTRTGVTDLNQRLIHMQYGDIVPAPSTTNGSLTPGAWEYGVPNGRYTVTVAVGDQPGAAKTGCAAPCYDSQHTVRVEGVTAIDRFQATAAAEDKTGTVTVDVIDGKLTIDAVGGTNTKLHYAEITSAGPVTPDTTPPAAPAGLTGTAGNSTVTLTWSAPADTDVAGYNIYRSTALPVPTTQAARQNTGLVAVTNFNNDQLTNGTTYHYAVTAVDQSGNESAASTPASLTPTDAAPAAISARIDFQDAASTPAANYIADWGQAFGPRTSANQGTGNTYGWMGLTSNTPLDMVGNGRNRNVVGPGNTTSANQPDLRLATFMHMQLAATTNGGTTTPGKWEMAVPNGAYTVTVAVGDAATAVDSSNWINVENQNSIASFVPTSTNKFATVTRFVVVSDGRLTISPLSGTNTKIAYVDIDSLDLAGRPYSSAVNPANLATAVVTNSSVTADNQLNADNGAVDEATLGNGHVKLTKVLTGQAVAGTGVTSGGSDTVAFQASAALDPETLYRFEITADVKDRSGRAFLPFSSVFTTSAGIGGGTSNVAFDPSDSGASKGKSYTSVVVGPDGKLYAGSIYGQIYRWNINADGTLSGEQVINTVRTHATAKGWEGAPNRTVIGLTFDPASTPTNPILWITDNYAYLGSDVPDVTGSIAKLTGPDLENYQEIVVNLPRSIKDHETNSIAIHDGKLYITQGSMNAMGATDGTWKRAEHLLSAAVLELDPAKLPATLPVDVATPDVNAPARGGVAAHTGTYNPYAPDAPLTLYATGVRNAFDLIWHSNGRLYTGTNGSAAGGATPATPATLPASCANRADAPATTPSAPGIANNQQAETDYVFRISKGRYYGHPNPMRCEYVLNAGNPNGYTGNPLFKVNAYPAGQQADPNYDLAGVNDAGLHASANGTIEYRNTTAFGGALTGKLIVVRYSANQEVVSFTVNGDGSLSAATTGITGFTGFKQPLDIAQDIGTGNLYVTELTDNPATTGIKLLKPQGGGGSGKAEPTSRLVFTDVKGGAASAAQNVIVKNTGAAPLTISAATLTGANSALFARAGGPSLPTTVAAGQSVSFPITFNPAVAGPFGAALQLTTDSPVTPTTSTTLRGLGTDGLGGSNEPSLQWILDTLQIPVDVGDPDKTNNDMPAGSALIGDEVKIESFTKASFDRVVSVEALSLFGPAGPTANPNVVTVGVHPSTDPTNRTGLFTGPNSSNQTVLPVVTPIGTGDYDLDAAFGFDFTWHGLTDRISSSENALNLWDPTNPHKVRVYPLKNADGSVEPNAYIVAPEDVLTPVDFQDAAIIVRNVKPAVTSGAGKLSASPTELVFSTVKGSTTAAKTVTLTNSGTSPLVISSMTATGTNAASFTVSATPQTLAVGGTATISVTFNPATSSVTGYQAAALRVISDDPNASTYDIGLFGLATTGEQGNNEPPLKAVVDTLGRNIDVGGTGLILGTNPAPIGDEVSAPLFVKAGTGAVTIKPVARYSPDELLPFGWYTNPAGDPILNEVATIALNQEQTLNPAIVAGGGNSFDPGNQSFGVYVKSISFGRNTYTQDGINTNIPHGARTYPAKNRLGVVIPNTYLVAFEDAQNGDYQDYVFEISNARPAAGGTTSPVARIDFQPATSTVAAGYTADTGAAFSTATGFGWVIPGTSTPLDMTAQTRDRAGVTEAKLRTLILMQPTAAQSPTGPGAWEYVVPNGTYVVTVGAGDPSFVDSTYRVQVEGQTAINNVVPTTANPSTTGSATVTVTDGRLTIDAIGGANTKLQYVDIDRPGATVDTTPPTVLASVTGLQSGPNVFKNKATVAVVASDAGSGVAGSSYKLDGGAFTPYTEPVEVTALGAHTIQARALDVAGNLATSAVTNFSIVAAGASTAEITLENNDGVPFADRLVMNRIQSPQTGTTCRDAAACDPVTGPFFPANIVHDVSTLLIRNTGTEPLNVTGLAVTGPFALVNNQTLPALIAVNGVLQVPVRFTATSNGTSAGLWSGTLTVNSDDADEPSLPVQLSGFWQSVSEGGQEPGIAELAKLFGYGTTIAANGVPLNENGLVHATGDEVLSPYWLRANAATPVAVRQLAAFHTQGNTATFRWHAKTSLQTTTVFTHQGAEGQSILPHKSNPTSDFAAGTFSPTTAFGFNIDGEWSDPTKNNQTADVTNGCTGPCGHHVRAWVARDRSGAVIPNTYLVSMDYSGINYDYNDNVYLVSNIKPELATDPATPGLLPGAAALKLDFDTTYPGTLLDKDDQTTGFRSTQPNKLDLTTGANSYDKALLDVNTAAPGTLAVTSSGTATAGTNGAADNTLVNGLRLPFDASGGRFTVSGRVLGSVAMLDAGSEQEAVQFGPDQDNYAKVAVINKNGVPSIEFYGEQNGAGVTVGSTVAVPAASAVTSLDLALIGDPSTGTITAAYRVNDGTWTVLPTALTLPTTAVGKFFGQQAQAGILVSHKGGAQFVATFDSFAISAGNITAPAPAREALYRLDVAGTGNYTDVLGNIWTPDTGRYTPATAVAEGTNTTPLEIAGTEDDVLYRTYRGNVGNVAQDQRVLSYSLPSRGATKVDLRLHFAERAAGNNAVGKRVFSIDVEGATVRQGFDIFAAAGDVNTATVLPIDNVTVVGGAVNLTLRASVDYPSIAAIEVLCQGNCPVDTTAPAAPAGLAATASQAGVALDWTDNAEADLIGYDVYRAATEAGPFSKLNATPVATSAYTDNSAAPNTTYAYRVTAVDSSENVSPPSTTVTATTPAPPVQQPIRINTGGAAQTVGNTAWSACATVTTCSGWVSGGNPYSETDTITGIPAGLNNTIFQSEWTGTAATGSRAFGFAVPVLNGNYQVRLHFAELNKSAANTRTFDVRLENTTVLSNFDIWTAAGGIDRAIVRQFPVTVTDGVMTIDFIRRIENAKISAIEIVPVDTTAPAAVTGVTAAGVATGVNLGWSASTATDLAGYNVYRSGSATGTFTKVNAALLTGTTYADTTAPQGVTSYYQVTATDISGNESAKSSTVNALRPDTTAPAAVTGVSATGVATGINLGWTARTESDLAGYNVYRSGSATGTFTKVNAAVLIGTTYADTTAPVGVASFYQVTAVDQAGNESVRSATVNAVRPDTTAPDAVTGVTATASTAGVTVGWSASTATDLAGYNVYRSGSATGTFTKVNAAVLTGTTYADTTAPQGVTSYYQVTATDISGNESAKSSTVNALRPDTTAPAAVTGVSATGVATGINLGWTARTESDLAGYNVYRSGSATGTFTKVNAAVLIGTTYADTTAPVGVASFYQVTAVDQAGNESVRSATVNAVRPDTTAPDAVTGVTATASTAGVTVGWSASTATDLGGYNVYRSGSATGTFTKVNAAVLTGTTYADTTAPVGVASFYQVTAVDQVGNESVRSATVNATRPEPPTSATTVRINAGGPAVTVGGVQWAADQSFTGGKSYVNAVPIAGTTNDVLFQSERSNTSFSYSIPVADGTYDVRLHFAEIYWGANGGGAGGTGRRVFSANIEGGAVELANFDMNAVAAPMTAIVRSYRSTITDGRVDIAFAATVNQAKVSAIEIIPADTTAPAAVTGVTATASTAGVTVGWSASTATDLAGYNVYRSGSATGTFTKVNAAVLTGTTYADTTAPVGVASFYQVTAVDQAGNESVRSATVNATRPEPPTSATTVRINAGGPAVTVGGVQWAADQSFTGGKSYVNAVPIAGTTNDVLFQSERSNTSFSYSIPVADGTYDVRLHFAEIYWGANGGGAGGTGRRVFSANIEGGAVELANFDMNAVAAPMTAIVRSYRSTITDGRVDIAFAATVNQAKVSAIEIIPADTTAPAAVTGVTATASTAGVTVGWSASTATDLAGYNVYRSGSATGTFTKVNAALLTGTTYADTTAPQGVTSYYQVTATDISGNESAKSSTVNATRPAAARPTIRINTGGTAQTVSGTGWTACTAITACSGWVSGGFAYSENDTISGLPAGTNNTLFRSEWTGGATGSNAVAVGARAFGFQVPVPNGTYQVRLHFAELNKTAPNTRTFDVRLENTTVLSSFDVFAQAGGIDRAIVRQFPVTVADGQLTIDFIRRIENAKISAIEIIPIG